MYDLVNCGFGSISCHDNILKLYNTLTVQGVPYVTSCPAAEITDIFWYWLYIAFLL